MKILAIVKYSVTLVGLGLLAGAIFMLSNTRAFLKKAIPAEGTVIEVVRSQSTSSSSDNSPTYRPVVRFLTQDGQEVVFTSSVGTNPPSHYEGDLVEVLYQSDQPKKARLTDFFSLWGGASVLGGLGSVSFLVGAGMFAYPLLKGRREKYLRSAGTPIQTLFQSVERNTAISVNGRHPFQVLTQWQNPATSEIHVFRSNNLWWDPTQHIVNKAITVFIEKNNPKKYCVDLSFLPHKAG